MQTEAALDAGTLHPFKCPIVDQDNATVACKDSNHLSDLQIRGMNFYVKGIAEKVPGK